MCICIHLMSLLRKVMSGNILNILELFYGRNLLNLIRMFYLLMIRWIWGFGILGNFKLFSLLIVRRFLLILVDWKLFRNFIRFWFVRKRLLNLEHLLLRRNLRKLINFIIFLTLSFVLWLTRSLYLLQMMSEFTIILQDL